MHPSLPLHVADIMTRAVITISESDSVEDVEKVMDQFRFRHLPVVRGSKLVGIITQRDMLRISASSFSSERASRDDLIHRVPSSRVMRDVVTTVSPDDSVAEAGELMWDMKIGCLCVTDQDDNLLGIVTESDFIILALDLLRRVSGANAPPPPKPKFVGLAG